MKTRKIVGTALLGVAFAAAATGSASAVPAAQPDPVGGLTGPLESVTGATSGNGAENTPTPSLDQLGQLGQLNQLTGLLPTSVLPIGLV